MNKVILSGKIGKDVQFREGKVNVAGFSFATTEYVKNGENFTEETEWHTIKVFGKLADKAKAYGKGDYLEIEGKIKTNKYKNKDGVEVVVKEIIADRVTRVRKAEAKVVPQPVQAVQQPQQSVNISQEIYQDQNADGDLPF
jgi:single-strand DNA-binding protein